MEEEEEQRQAVFFDFDGLFFQPDTRWKVVQSSLEKLGTRLSFEECCRFFDGVVSAKRDARISDYFGIGEYKFDEVEFSPDRNVVQPGTLPEEVLPLTSPVRALG